MADERDAGRGEGQADQPAAGGRAYEPPAGCGFTGCMWFIIVGFSLLMAVLVFGLLAREWVTPIVSPR